jgi:hypothetical protein
MAGDPGATVEYGGAVDFHNVAAGVVDVLDQNSGGIEDAGKLVRIVIEVTKLDWGLRQERDGTY